MLSPSDCCLSSTKLCSFYYFTLTCTEKPLTKLVKISLYYPNNKFFSMTLFFKRIIIQLSVSFLSYSVFNEHVTFFEKKGNQRNFKLLRLVVLVGPLVLSCAYARVLCAFALVGPSGLEPPTSCLSGTRSNLLSYDPSWLVSGYSLGWWR